MAQGIVRSINTHSSRDALSILHLKKTPIRGTRQLLSRFHRDCIATGINGENALIYRPSKRVYSLRHAIASTTNTMIL